MNETTKLNTYIKKDFLIFRVVENKLNQVKTKVADVDEFIRKNNSKFTKFIKVDKKKLPTSSYRENFYEIDTDGNIIVDIARSNAREDILVQKQKDALLKELLKLCDDKSVEVKNYINGGEVTEELLQRYKQKEIIAKEYLANGSNKEELQLEADLKGISVDDLASAIVNLSEAYMAKSNYFFGLIEAFRVKCKEIILSNDFVTAKAIMDKAKTMGADATGADIKALFEIGA